MVEFTNAVADEPIEYLVAEQSTLALSRGSKGFFAMGNLDRDFETGLPDGEYCDIISECQQKIQVNWLLSCSWYDFPILQIVSFFVFDFSEFFCLIYASNWSNKNWMFYIKSPYLRIPKFIGFWQIRM